MISDERLARINPLNTPEEIDKYLGRNLPKWPQMIVTGRPVKEVQARGIIRRTDRFFTHSRGGNDHEWNAEVKKSVGMPMDDYAYDETRDWRKKWDCVVTEYVHNSWVSCSSIFGPNGWCHPDGMIGYTRYVGDWPHVVDILEDWSTIAREFPFLDLGITLLDRGESGEDEDGGRPVVDICVQDGRVAFFDNGDVHGSRVPAPTERKSLGLMLHGRHRQRESAIPEAWLPIWAAIAREKGLV